MPWRGCLEALHERLQVWNACFSRVLQMLAAFKFCYCSAGFPSQPPQQPFSCGGGYRVEVMGKRRPLKYNFLFSVPNLCTLVFQRCLVTLNRVSDNADNGFLAHNGEMRRSWRADGGKYGWAWKSAVNPDQRLRQPGVVGMVGSGA